MKTLTEQLDGKCKHFNGPYNETCRAGVNYRQLADDSRPGYLNRLPCKKTHFKEDVIAPCALLEWKTPEDVAAEEAMIKAELAKMMEEMANDICPHCHQPITEYQQVSRCVYAKPCGHRQYQGKVPTDRPHVIVEEYPEWTDEE